MRPAAKKKLVPQLVTDLLSLLTPREKSQLYLVLAVMNTAAILEIAGIASIVPFLSLLADPAIVDRNQILAWIHKSLGFPEEKTFFLIAGILMLVLLATRNVASGFSTWAILRYSWMRNHTISTKLVAGYLSQPYTFFLSRNSAELSRNILSEVQVVVSRILVQSLTILERSIRITFILVALLILNPGLSTVVIVLFGGAYSFLYWLVRRRLGRMGQKRLSSQGRRFQITSEIFSGVKELKLLGLEKNFERMYAKPSAEFSKIMAAAGGYAQLPRFFLETIAFGSMLCIMISILATGRSLQRALPLIGFYTFAAYRLLPSLQAVFSGVTAVRFNRSSLDTLREDLAEKTKARHIEKSCGGDAHLTFENSVDMGSVSYTYPESKRQVVSDINLRIKRGEWVAIVGPTGSGKSTMVDILLGLLVPSIGEVTVDGKVLHEETIPLWQKHLGYVPQSIVLFDDTIERNIYFGQEDSAIDRVELIKTARIAQIHEFISTELADGYSTYIGERGVRLSGGQRQRIGIARALIRNPDFLVLDEATNALDKETEQAFFTALRKHLVDTSVVSIAHRISTTRYFDRVIRIDGGRLIDDG